MPEPSRVPPAGPAAESAGSPDTKQAPESAELPEPQPAPGPRSVSMPLSLVVTASLVVGLLVGLLVGWLIPRPGDSAQAAGAASASPSATDATPVAPGESDAPSGDSSAVDARPTTLTPAQPQPLAGGPAGTEEFGGYAFGSGEQLVELFEDYVCPFCARLEQNAGADLRAAAEEGQYRFVLHPMAFLTEDSARAANASACVYEYAGAEDWVGFHEALYEAQDPTEALGQFSVPNLEDIAEQTGVDSREVSTCIEDDAFGEWVAALTQAASTRGVRGTPTLAVDGSIADTSGLLQP